VLFTLVGVRTLPTLLQKVGEVLPPVSVLLRGRLRTGQLALSQEIGARYPATRQNANDSFFFAAGEMKQ